MVFVVVNYSHKAARHVCLCVSIGLLWVFMLLSFLCPLTDMMCRASNPLLSSIVMVFALIE